ncbi:MAG: DUF4418 family protein [Clostridia bacterium]|nr:DUF4418 family protein [Clostridia bacterium]
MKEKISYFITVLGGLFLVIAPQTFLHPCQMDGMACTYMAKAASLIGIIITALGAGGFFIRGRGTHLFASAMIVLATLVEASVPHILGYCEMETMSCVLRTVPGIYVGSALIGINGAVRFLIALRSAGKGENVY